MTEVGTAWVKVRPKTDTFDQELQSSVIGPLKHVAEIAGITFGLDKAAGFFGDAIQGAVQLDQAQRRVNFAFGDGADSVIKFGETAAQKIGASAKAADIANASFGNMFKSAGLEDGKQIADMSTTLTQRAADLAAATGHDLPTAQNAFQMAMLGSTRSLREFGIRMTPQELPLEALKLGLIEPTVNADKLRTATDAVTKAQDALNVAIKKHGANSDEAKVATDKLTNAQDALGKIADGSLPKLNDEQTALAAYQLILDKTSASAGYYAANTDSAAEKQQALSARWDDAKDKLGAGLLPIAERFTDWATNAIPTVEKVFDAFGPAASRDIGIIGDDLGTIANVVGPPLKEVLSYAGDHMGLIRDAAAVLVGLKVADWAHGVLGGFKSIEGDGVFGRLETKFKSVFLPTFSAGDKAKVTAECEGMCASCKCAPGIGGPGGGGGGVVPVGEGGATVAGEKAAPRSRIGALGSGLLLYGPTAVIGANMLLNPDQPFGPPLVQGVSSPGQDQGSPATMQTGDGKVKVGTHHFDENGNLWFIPADGSRPVFIQGPHGEGISPGLQSPTPVPSQTGDVFGATGVFSQPTHIPLERTGSADPTAGLDEAATKHQGILGIIERERAGIENQIAVQQAVNHQLSTARDYLGDHVASTGQTNTNIGRTGGLLQPVITNAQTLQGALGGSATSVTGIQSALDILAKDRGWTDILGMAQTWEGTQNGILSAIGKAVDALHNQAVGATGPRAPGATTPANLDKASIVVHGDVHVTASDPASLHAALTQAAGAAGTRS